MGNNKQNFPLHSLFFAKEAGVDVTVDDTAVILNDNSPKIQVKWNAIMFRLRVWLRSVGRLPP